MTPEYVEDVVLEELGYFGLVIAEKEGEGATECTYYQGGPNWNEAAAGGYRDQATNSSRTEAHDGPLLSQEVL